MKKLLLIFMLSCCGQTFAQQDALYSQYMFNPFAVNPAYAGSRSSYSTVLLQRFQWLGIDGAPLTGSFAIHAPTTKWNLVWGAGIVVDKIGPTMNTNFGGTIGYQIKMKKAKLTLALRGGAYHVALDRGALKFKDLNDQFNIANGGFDQTTVPSFDFGAYYFTKKFYVGMSMNHLSGGKIAFKDAGLADSAGLFLRQHVFITSGYAIDVNPNIVMKPSIMAKYAFGAPPNIDLNFSTLFYKRIWFGLSLRSSASVVLMTDINITDFMRIGYAFDYAFTKIQSYVTGGSHEIFIGFDFNLKKNTSVSPRYL
jgi:type IX secretion system PorP/SprF family membrane protein